MYHHGIAMPAVAIKVTGVTPIGSMARNAGIIASTTKPPTTAPRSMAAKACSRGSRLKCGVERAASYG